MDATRSGDFDLVVIGGGINGTGIARDAAGRGLSVLLCEQGDLAGATSSAATKLIHGGLRYLEMYEFRLVREALGEREVLLRNAPHIIWPLRLVLPHNPALRPAWFVRLGLFVYDHLYFGRSLPGTMTLNLRRDPKGAPLRKDLGIAFEFSDCWVLDARLVVLNAMDAAERGAEVLVGTRCVAAKREGDRWRVTLRDQASGAERTVTARALVNAAGPWVEGVLKDVVGRRDPARTRMVKGSHIVVPKLYEGDHAYFLQNADRRIAFVIPYEGDFSLIGTTDVPYEGDPAQVGISPEETQYLCDLVNRYFERPIAPTDVVWSYAGVRPLYDDSAANPSAITRDYVFDIEAPAGQAPLLSIYGGKITTYRQLARHALKRLRKHFPGMGSDWTAGAPLPGGDLPDADFDRFARSFAKSHPWLPPTLAHRYARLYGTRAYDVVAGATSLEALGRDFGSGIYEAELNYAVTREFVRQADDFLWRRTKLGLRVDPETRAAVERWIAERPPQVPSSKPSIQLEVTRGAKTG